VILGKSLTVDIVVVQILLLQQHYRWARVTSSNDAVRLQVSATPSSNNNRSNNDDEARTQVKTAADMQMDFDVAIQ